MAEVELDYIVYTWSRHRLDGGPPGLGVTQRSVGWPRDLELPREVVHLSSAARDAEGSTYGGFFQLPNGALLVVSRVLGNDGSGRPGNFVTVAALDPTRTLGALDLFYLVDENLFVLDDRIDVPAHDGAPRMQIRMDESWSRYLASMQAEELTDSGRREAVRGAEAPTRHVEPALYTNFGDAADVMTSLAQVLPPSMVNSIPLWIGEYEPPEVQPVFTADEAATVKEAGVLGLNKTAQWWRRQRGTDWAALASQYTALMTQTQQQSAVELSQALDLFPESDVSELVLTELATRFDELDTTAPDLGQLAERVLRHALAISSERALQVLIGGASVLDDDDLRALIEVYREHGGVFSNVGTLSASPAQRVLKLAGLSAEATNSVPAEARPSEPAPSQSGAEERRQVESLRELRRTSPGPVMTSLMRQADEFGAKPADIWEASGMRPENDEAFVSASRACADYWLETVFDWSGSDRRAMLRVRRNATAVVRQLSVPEPVASHYLSTLRRNSRLERSLYLAGLLLIISTALSLFILMLG